MILLLFLWPSFLHAQEVKTGASSTFHERTIESAQIFIKNDQNNLSAIGFIIVDTLVYVSISSPDGTAAPVHPNEQLLFVLDDYNVVTATLSDSRMFDEGKSYRHRYLISRSDLERLAINPVRRIRKYVTNRFTDMDMTTRTRERFMDLCRATLRHLYSR